MKFSILDNLKLGPKLGILALIALLMTAFPFYQFYTTQQGKIDFAKKEISGIEPVRATIKVAQQFAAHRGLSTAAILGNADSTNALAPKQAELTQLIKKVDDTLAEFGEAGTTAEWAKVKSEWNSVSAASANKATIYTANFDAHTALIKHVISFIELLSDTSLMSFDPDSHTYFMIQAGVTELPKDYEFLGQARGFGTAILQEAASRRPDASSAAVKGDVAKGDTAKMGSFSAEDRSRLQVILDLQIFFAGSSTNFFTKAIKEMPRIGSRLQADLTTTSEVQKDLPLLTRKQLLTTAVPTTTPSEYFGQYTKSMNSVAKLNDLALDVLGEELNTIAGGHRQFQLLISGLVLAFVALGALIGYFIVRNITGTVNSLQKSVEKVRGGDFEALSAVTSKDEVGDLGRTVNSLLQERVAALAKAEKENDTLNNSVIGLLGTVADLSQKDLTVRAPVTEDIIGTLGDSVNQLTDATTSVLRDVSKIAGVVEHASKRVKAQSDAVSEQATAERATVEKLVANLQLATDGMGKVAELAQSSNRAASDASTSTENAMNTVQSTVRGMDAIRDTISEMEKRIKRLGERSQEISQIVGLINTISERTHVLSLNASMQAAMAGDAGRGFAVVAEEVQRLAENSRQATAQIASLVQNIQIETNDTIATVNKTIDQVVQGSEMARVSGDKMRETRATTERLVQLVQNIAESSLAQMKLVESLRVGAGEITESTEKTAEQLNAQNQVTSSLVTASQKLVESVSVFKLPVVVQS
jgi:twitching motility protein PilJ